MSGRSGRSSDIGMPVTLDTSGTRLIGISPKVFAQRQTGGCVIPNLRPRAEYPPATSTARCAARRLAATIFLLVNFLIREQYQTVTNVVNGEQSMSLLMAGTKKSLATIHGRIKYVRTSAGLTQTEFARAIDVRPQMVNQWERGPKSPHPDNLFKIHELSNAPIHWLLYGGALPEQDESGKFIYLRQGGLVQMRSMLEAAQGVQSSAKQQLVSTTYPCSTRAFAVKAVDTSNEPKFPVGTTYIFDPSITPKPTDIVLAVSGEQRQPTIGEYRAAVTKKGRGFMVQPLNEAFAAVRSDIDNVEVVGVMTEAVLRGRPAE